MAFAPGTQRLGGLASAAVRRQRGKKITPIRNKKKNWMTTVTNYHPTVQGMRTRLKKVNFIGGKPGTKKN